MLTLTNYFHQSCIYVYPVGMKLSKGQLIRISKKLCPGKGCGCHETFGIKGQQIYNGRRIYLVEQPDGSAIIKWIDRL